MCEQCGLRAHSAKGPLTAQQARKRDPTLTTGLRQKFVRDMDSRFNQLNRLIRETVITNDALGLKVNAAAAGRRAFDFPRSAAKVEAFMRWLRLTQDELLFEVTRGTRRAVTGNALWADVYLESAYQRGLATASSQMAGMGVAVGSNYINNAWYRPIHADSIGLIYTRTYSDLKGVTEAMDGRISRALAQGLAEGLSSDKIAKELFKVVSTIGKTRARVIARTEVVNAVSEASLNSYEEAEIEGVQLDAEFSTSGDEAVCEKCDALSKAGPYTIKQARGLIPAHPNCRCGWRPIVTDPRRASLS